MDKRKREFLMIIYSGIFFEKENHLFDLQDEYGTYYWDIFRYEIYALLLWKGGGGSSSQKRTIKYIITKVFSMFYEFFRVLFLCSKAENLFYLSFEQIGVRFHGRILKWISNFNEVLLEIHFINYVILQILAFMTEIFSFKDRK